MKETRTRIKEVSQARGIGTAYQLQKATGLPPGTANRLYNDRVEAISLTTINVLCDALECEPGDLLVRVEELKPIKKRKT